MTAAEKKPLVAKIFSRFSKFFAWLAKGQEGNLSCTG